MKKPCILDTSGWSRLWMLPVFTMLAFCLVSAYGACSDCEMPNPDYDPTNPYETDPECILDPDKASKPGTDFDNKGSGETTIVTNKQYETYDLHGSTLGQVLFDAIRNGSLNGHAGKTVGVFSWTFNMDGDSEELPCPCEDGSAAFESTANVDISAILSLTITLPRWVEYDQGTCRAKREWDKFSAALREHEEKHVKTFEDAATGLIASLSGLHVTRVVCGGNDVSAREAAFDALEAEVEKIFNQAAQKVDSDGDALDAPGSPHAVPPLNTSEEGDCP